MAKIVSKTIQASCDLLKFHSLHPERYPFLLESVVQSSTTRFDILLAFPTQKITSNVDGTFLENFSQAFEKESYDYQTDVNLPFIGGWFLFLDYELSHEIEPILDRKNNYKTHSFATRVTAAIIQDKQTGTVHFISEQAHEAQLEIMLADYAMLQDLPSVSADKIVIENLLEDDPQQFIKGVEKIKKYIVEGDVFQVNLSRQWQGNLAQATSPDEMYAALRQQNPASFSGLAVCNETEIISSSPERLVKVQNRKIETRPIAGTRSRAKDKKEDARLAKELLDHPKEQAEHIMLIDLERNDMGRVCEYGSVKVDELMVLESYTHVHHIVSNIKGKLREDVGPVDVIKAVFPGGTITGCPKVRCMEIISELEQSPRGAYTGSMGYVNHNGDMDLNILIRTIEKRGDSFLFRTGAGIVHDSVPEWEVKETGFKAKGLLKVFTHE